MKYACIEDDHDCFAEELSWEEVRAKISWCESDSQDAFVPENYGYRVVRVTLGKGMIKVLIL